MLVLLGLCQRAFSRYECISHPAELWDIMDCKICIFLLSMFNILTVFYFYLVCADQF
jgi:hypothetical protein